jgi:hypothetical protein
MALSASRGWSEESVRQALTQSLLPGLTAGNLGVQWVKRSSTAGDYLELDGAVPLFATVNGKLLLLSNDSALMENLLVRLQKSGQTCEKRTNTYTALFRHTQEQNNFGRLMAQLDLAGHGSASSQEASADAATPAFFTGNVASLSRVFANVESEHIEENDRGATVTQTVTYQWAR